MRPVPQAEPAGKTLPPAHATRLRGWVDLGTLGRDSHVAVNRHTDSTLELSALGLLVQLNPTTVDWHIGPRSIALAFGSPIRNGVRVPAAEFASSAGGGLRAAPQIGGRFALVVIDRVERSVQFRTDRFGVFPLCWGREDKRFAFADRADGVPLLDAPPLDFQSILDYVYFHMIPAPRTVFSGVFRLEPASELQCSQSGVTVRAAWEPEFSHQRQGSLSELSVRFRDSIRDSVASEFGTSAIGCYLSGGTDSSTVAGTLKRLTGQAATFSIGFNQPGYDEMAYARIAALHFGTDHHEHYVTPAELVDCIPSVAAHYDQPFGNSSAVPAFICARLARSSGVVKLLAGDGGDELFGGNQRYAKQKIFEAWWAVPEPVRQALAPVFNNALTRRLPLARKLASYVDQAQVPMPARLETYNLLRRFGPENVFESGFLDLVKPGEPEALQRRIYDLRLAAPFVDRMLAYDWRFTLADNDLPKVCGTARLAGAEVGFPLLADSLVDLSTRLSPRDKVRGLRLRHFFKESLRDFLPPEIIAKKKHGFGLPVGRWLVSDTALRNLAQESLAALAARRLIRTGLVDDLFSRRLEEHAGYYGEMIWVLMQLEQWLSAHRPKWRAG